MRIKVLMTGNSPLPMSVEAEVLKNKGFLVYQCAEENVEAMIAEINPDVVYINPTHPGLQSTQVYHHLLNNIAYASIPVIYTLMEDDVYLVNRKRTASRDKRNVICDNLVDAIKVCLIPSARVTRKRNMATNTLPFPTYLFRA